QVADADQLEHAVIHAEHDVARKIEFADVSGDLLVPQHAAEAQQADVAVERHEMPQDPAPVALTERLDQHRALAAPAEHVLEPALERLILWFVLHDHPDLCTAPIRYCNGSGRQTR